ncbi:hypothetical protein ACLKA6_005903 [Drosophila palustris]
MLLVLVTFVAITCSRAAGVHSDHDSSSRHQTGLNMCQNPPNPSATSPPPYPVPIRQSPFMNENDPHKCLQARGATPDGATNGYPSPASSFWPCPHH